MHLDHLILPVNDRESSVRFFTQILGLRCEGESGPFTIIRVTPDLTLQLAAWEQPAVSTWDSQSAPEFNSTFERIREADVAYGDSFHTVGNVQGPGREDGARGLATSLYVFDPNQHLIGIRSYDL
jgi:catechol 2,3-dioxygenase-like lactoylglutathione lyase family enzyme